MNTLAKPKPIHLLTKNNHRLVIWAIEYVEATFGKRTPSQCWGRHRKTGLQAPHLWCTVGTWAAKLGMASILAALPDNRRFRIQSFWTNEKLTCNPSPLIGPKMNFNFLYWFLWSFVKGWLGIAKLKPLVERYSCQPMRRLDTSNNLSVGPSCMWRTWNQC